MPQKNEIVDLQSNINITSNSVTLYDAKNYKTLYSENGFTPREIASLTKIMTCYIVCTKLQKKEISQT